MSLRYFALNDGIGLAPAYVRTKAGLEIPNERAGEPDAIHEVGLPFYVPKLAGDDVVDGTERAVIRPAEQRDPRIDSRVIPGTRVIETANWRVINSILATGHYHEVDPPVDVQPRRAKSTAKNQER